MGKSNVQPKSYARFTFSRRLNAFFMTLFNCLRSGAKLENSILLIHRAVIQLYPETPEQMELISRSAMKCGFVGGLVVDYPNRFVAKTNSNQ